MTTAAGERAVPTMLDVTDLAVEFAVAARGSSQTVRAVDGVSLTVRAGETVSVVGESGCGKTTLARAVVRLLTPAEGRIVFASKDITRMGESQLRRIRPELQMIFQDPFSSLDPHMRVGDIIGEPFRLHTSMSRSQRTKRVAELMEMVGLDAAAAGRRPAEFSGGQRQRIGIARAIGMEPRLLVCDEPTSGLDVSVQAQILNLLNDLKQRLGLTILFISHNLAVVRHISDRVAVMYLGRVVEEGSVDQIFASPRHPYTKALLAVVPDPGEARGRERHTAVLSGDIPSPLNRPDGCHFRSRCPLAVDVCAEQFPPFDEVEPGHRSACWRSKDVPAWTPTPATVHAGTDPGAPEAAGKGR